MMLPRKYREFKKKYAWAIEFEQKFFDIQDEDIQPDFYKRLREGTGNITKKDVSVAWFLKEHPEYLTSSTAEIAKEVEVSQRNLTDFARRLGYKGFLDFRQMNRALEKK